MSSEGQLEQVNMKRPLGKLLRKCSNGLKKEEKYLKRRSGKQKEKEMKIVSKVRSTSAGIFYKLGQHNFDS